MDASTSHARPPAEITADPSQYGLLGARLQADTDWGIALLSGRYGAALAGSEGRWLQGDAVVATGRRMGIVGVRGRAGLFGLRYLDPFPYNAAGLDLHPALAVPLAGSIFSARPRLTFGSWSTDAADGRLAVLGGAVELQRSFGAASLRGSLDAADVENGVTAGAFLGADAEARMDRGRWSAALALRVQRSPLETDVGGGLHLNVTVAPGAELRGYVGRRVRDPLYGTAGSVAASLSVAIRGARWTPPEPPPVVAVGEARGAGRVTRFAIRAEGAGSVALMGDFTGWDPVPMEARDDGWWRVERVLAPGLHHFGFLVDGEWVIPPDAPGVADDGWGRRNASVVVEP